MADEHTMWSKTLLDGFVRGMKKKPSDEWIKEQTKELAERGISVDYVFKVLCKEASDDVADRFLNVVGGSPAARRRGARKKGFLSSLFSKLFGR